MLEFDPELRTLVYDLQRVATRNRHGAYAGGPPATLAGTQVQDSANAHGRGANICSRGLQSLPDRIASPVGSTRGLPICAAILSMKFEAKTRPAPARQSDRCGSGFADASGAGRGASESRNHYQLSQGWLALTLVEIAITPIRDDAKIGCAGLSPVSVCSKNSRLTNQSKLCRQRRLSAASARPDSRPGERRSSLPRRDRC